MSIQSAFGRLLPTAQQVQEVHERMRLRALRDPRRLRFGLSGCMPIRRAATVSISDLANNSANSLVKARLIAV